MSEINGENQETKKQRFHLDKSISIGNLIAIIALISPVIVWLINLDKKQEAMQMQITFSDIRAQESRERIKESLQSINEQLHELNSSRRNR
jgi:hypothetical protein